MPRAMTGIPRTSFVVPRNSQQLGLRRSDCRLDTDACPRSAAQSAAQPGRQGLTGWLGSARLALGLAWVWLFLGFGLIWIGFLDSVAVHLLGF